MHFQSVHIYLNNFMKLREKFCDFGLGYDSIHACKYHYVLCQKEFANCQSLPVYDESWYKIDSGKGKKIPKKVLRHFPLIPRLKRLFFFYFFYQNILLLRWDDIRINELTQRMFYDIQLMLQDGSTSIENFLNFPQSQEMFV